MDAKQVEKVAAEYINKLNVNFIVYKTQGLC